MGIFQKEKIEYEDPNLTEDKTNILENNIRNFIIEQKENIKLIFNDKDLILQNIDYIVDANSNIRKEENPNPLNNIKDFVIQWSIQGNNTVNSTKCHLTFFNLGGLLGADGFLYSICLFYYYFAKIPNENRNKKDIVEDIEKCLEFIDNGNLTELNSIWRTNINEDILNNLRIAKDFLINLFHEKITNDICLTTTQEILGEIALGHKPNHFLVAIGCATWSPSQLEEEIMGNLWLPVPASMEIIFETPYEKKWEKAISSLGFSTNQFAPRAGKA